MGGTAMGEDGIMVEAGEGGVTGTEDAMGGHTVATLLPLLSHTVAVVATLLSLLSHTVAVVATLLPLPLLSHKKVVGGDTAGKAEERGEVAERVEEEIERLVVDEVAGGEVETRLQTAMKSARQPDLHLRSATTAGMAI
jgi:hypothetical protein